MSDCTLNPSLYKISPSLIENKFFLQVADALATPFVGFHSDSNDNFWFCRYGRRKTWHLVGKYVKIFLSKAL